MWDEGYKYLREVDEQNVYLTADLYEANNREQKSTNLIAVAAVGLFLGAGVALAVRDQNDFYKFAAGGVAGAIAIWSFR